MIKMRNVFKYIILIIIAIFCYKPIVSNNIIISNISIVEQDAVSYSCKVQFNISWENSWRTLSGAMNWDAAWVFVKFKIGKNGNWQHATLSTNSSNHYAVSGSTIDAVSDGKGVFVYRSYTGSGNINYNGIKLKWNYGIDGVTDVDSIQVKVIGIEMVYVPQGSFYAGDYNTSTASFIQGSIDNDPWYIGNENAINVTGGIGSGTGSGQTIAEYYYQAYYGTPLEDSSGATFTIPKEFPKGYSAFYCMKYEISQGQYTEFLNMLTRQQQNTRTKTDISTSDIWYYYVMTNGNLETSGNTIICPQTNNGITQPIVFSTSTPERACNYISWSDLVAILDWSGLRPISELEFEKACRGTLNAVNGEYAWGNTDITTNIYGLSNIGYYNETIPNLGVNTGNAICLSTLSGAQNSPFRCGIFAGSSLNNSRQETGSTYYGICEMSGNLIELAITVGNSNGRVFTRANGDGLLDPNGDANVINWPGIDAYGSGSRGGHWSSSSSMLRISDRSTAAHYIYGRSNDVGGRGVRSVN